MVGSEQLPALKIGTIWAIFQSSGTTPDCNACVNNKQRIKLEKYSVFFNSLLLILPQPAVDDNFRLRIKVVIPSGLISISLKLSHEGGSSCGMVSELAVNTQVK